MYDCIVLGAGPAGVSAGIFCAKNNLKTLILTKEISPNLPPSLHTELSKLLDLARANFELKNKSVIASIEKNFTSFQVEDNKGESYFSKTLIIATGSSFKENLTPETKELWNKKIFPTSSLEPINFKKNTVAIYGSGQEALKSLYLLAKYSLNIISINPHKALVGSNTEKQKIEGRNNIVFKNNSVIKKVSQKSGSLIIDIEKNKSEIENLETEYLFVEQESVGNTDFERLTSKSPLGHIKTNALMETSVPGVFSAGDCTNSSGGIVGVSEGQGFRASLSAINFLLSAT